ncbi:MAG: protein-export chaperone SecB [Hyphomicrobiales bacterium]
MAKKPETKEAPAAPAEAAIEGEGLGGNGVAPSMRVLAQYVKDLSFENPNAPEVLMNEGANPQIDVSVNVNAKTISPSDYEVELQLEITAADDGNTVFAAELLYAGVFRLENIPEEHMHPIVLIECPRMIFPFARKILADATQSGGFPPLMLDPIDFGAMYQQRMAAETGEGATA